MGFEAANPAARSLHALHKIMGLKKTGVPLARSFLNLTSFPHLRTPTFPMWKRELGAPGVCADLVNHFKDNEIAYKMVEEWNDQ